MLNFLDVLLLRSDFAFEEFVLLDVLLLRIEVLLKTGDLVFEESHLLLSLEVFVLCLIALSLFDFELVVIEAHLLGHAVLLVNETVDLLLLLLVDILQLLVLVLLLLDLLDEAVLLLLRLLQLDLEHLVLVFDVVQVVKHQVILVLSGLELLVLDPKLVEHVVDIDLVALLEGRVVIVLLAVS